VTGPWLAAVDGTLAFRDKAGRAHMDKFDGIEANLDNVENYLISVLDPQGPVSG
jgi:hypothetical protein